MELNITNKGIELTQTENKLIQRKLGRLDRHFDGIIETKIEIIEETTKSRQDRFLVRVTVNGSSTQLHGEERGETVLTAVDKVAKVMERQLENHKGRLREKKIISASPDEEAAPLERNFVIKNLDIKPMSADEAADQMELLDYDFFFFSNTDTDKLSLLYRRKDGDYGLIEPEKKC